MANGMCRKCDRPAEAGPYCSSCAADVMAKAFKAFKPFHGGRRRKLPGLRGKCPSRPGAMSPKPYSKPPLFSL